MESLKVLAGLALLGIAFVATTLVRASDAGTVAATTNQKVVTVADVSDGEQPVNYAITAAVEYQAQALGIARTARQQTITGTLGGPAKQSGAPIGLRMGDEKTFAVVESNGSRHGESRFSGLSFRAEPHGDAIVVTYALVVYPSMERRWGESAGRPAIEHQGSIVLSEAGSTVVAVDSPDAKLKFALTLPVPTLAITNN